MSRTKSEVIPGKSVGVTKRPDGLWQARVIELDGSGKAVIVEESEPDVRAVAIERMQVWCAQLFLF
jgi:hypothetical protein